MNPSLKLELVVVGQEVLSTVIDYGRTKQKTVDGVRDIIEGILPQPSTIANAPDGFKLIANIYVDHKIISATQYDSISIDDVVKIENDLLDGLKQINTASLQ